MRALIQRADSGKVTVDGETVGAIGRGLVILVGVTHSDTLKDAAYVAEKCAYLRIFKDDEDKMNLSLLDVGGSALVISQFTLYGDTATGRRPFFGAAAPPEHAIPCYEAFIARLRELGIKVETGRFGARMKVELVNDGPVTVMVESKQ